MYKNFILAGTILSVFLLTSCNKPSENKDSQTQNSKSEINSDNPIGKSNSPAEILAKPEVPVLCYHRIENGRNDEYTVSPAAFSAQMQILKDSGYTAINPDELYDYLVYNKSLPEKSVMITFDDSRVEHATIAAPEMEKRGFKGVFFIMTITYNKKNYMTTDQIAQLAKSGHTVGLHSWDHTKTTKYDNDSIFKKNITEPRKKLEEIIGMPVNYFAYPYGLTNEATSKLMSDNFKISFILSTKRDTAVPLQTVRRMIVPSGWSPESMLKAMKRTFSNKI